jgi:glycogen operon protein
MSLPAVDLAHFCYQFYEEETIIADPYAKAFANRARYGVPQDPSLLRAKLSTQDFDWEEDRNPRIPYENSICYQLHVRGFTKHKSSGVKARGTFEGLVEKLPYLQDLGITTLELQPVYEFFEYRPATQNPAFPPNLPRLNYWGYENAFYFAPKTAYSHTKDPCTEFKNMMKSVHESGMEIVMQFYFPDEVRRHDIPFILHHWVMEYHVDGFRLMNPGSSLDWLLDDPILAGTKLWVDGIDSSHETNLRQESTKRLALYQDDYLRSIRSFLKGDASYALATARHLKESSPLYGNIHYVTGYHASPLLDMVSYEHRHNEDNGEDNRDASEPACTWNCGVEGDTRRTSIRALRLRQMKNALSFLFLSQGTPLLFMGDEFGNTQKGNNNPYCQDNEISWLNWNHASKWCDLTAFLKILISLRKDHPILHMSKPFQMTDYSSLGFPDLSFHGEQPWRPDFSGNSRFLGLLFCGAYAQDTTFYIAINMDWRTKTYALPRLPQERAWKFLFSTNTENPDISEEEQTIPPRSIVIHICDSFE